MITPGGSSRWISAIALFDGVHDVAAVRADEHHHDAGDRLALAVARDDAVAQRGADLAPRDVPHEHAACRPSAVRSTTFAISLFVLRAGPTPRKVNDSLARSM